MIVLRWILLVAIIFYVEAFSDIKIEQLKTFTSIPCQRKRSILISPLNSFPRKTLLKSMPQSNNEIKPREKIEVLLYRSTMIVASVAYTTEQFSKLLMGSGLAASTIENLEYTSQGIFAWGILLCALFAPSYLGAITDKDAKDDTDNAFFLLLNKSLPILASFAILVETINTIQSNLSQGTTNFLSVATDSLDNITPIFICAICLREIGFFGAPYKAEAIFALFFSIALALNDSIGFSEPALTSGLALSLLVLSFGKIFEPIMDDRIPNGSAFFKDTII